MTATETKLTTELKFVINSMFQFFGKDSIDHLWTLFTFATTKKPNALSIVQSEGIKKWFKFDN